MATEGDPGGDPRTDESPLASGQNGGDDTAPGDGGEREPAGHEPPDAPEGAHHSLEAHVPDAEAVDRVWRAYWLPMLIGPDGKISLDRLKGELYDAWFLVNEARQVYHHVTGGVTDDLTASAEGIIAMADRQIERREEKLRERIRELEVAARE